MNKMKLFLTYIAEDKLDNAIQIFQSELLERKKSSSHFVLKEINDALILISNNLTNLNNNNILGLIYRDQYNIEKNQIVNRLLNLSNRYSNYDFSIETKFGKYPIDAIQKTLEILETKFSHNSLYIKNLRRTLINDLAEFVSNNIGELFLTLSTGKIDPIILNKESRDKENAFREQFKNITNSWLEREATTQHINRIVNNWYSLNTQYIESEIRYIYTLNKISPDEFWTGFHVTYPDIRIDYQKWSTALTNDAVSASKRGEFFSVFVGNGFELLYLGYKLIRGEHTEKLDNNNIEEVFFEDFINKTLKSTTQNLFEENIYVQKSISSFSEDWILKNVVLQFDYLKMLKKQ